MNQTLMFLFCLFTICPAEAGSARIYVIFGQGGAWTSYGMVRLASDLERIPGAVVSTHVWEYPGVIVDDILRQPKGTPIILIGYSLGAGMTTFIANKVPNRAIALAVAYDPSVWAPPMPAGSNIARLICFKNDSLSNVYGKAGIAGKQVETVHINEGHMFVSYDHRLHEITTAAVHRVMEK